MAQPDLIHVGGDRFRVLPWHGEGDVALMSPIPGDRLPAPDAIRGCLALLADRGVREVVTGALAHLEVPGFLDAGFAVRERLHLLSHDLHPLPVEPRHIRLRRARPGDRPTVLAVDGAAFDSFWRLDDTSLDDAIGATAASRFRVTAGSPLIGYLITGRSGARGYLQRLAVDPAHQRSGVGSALVIDALRWLRRHGVQRAVVNTQETNAGALAMYERLGFRREAEGLSVLTRPTGSGR